MTGGTPGPATNAVPPVVRLAAHVEFAVAELQRGIAEVVIPQRELDERELELELIYDDLLVLVGDLAHVARDLRKLDP